MMHSATVGGWRMMMCVLAWIALAHSAHAHESRPAYLQMKQTGQDTFDVTWKVPAIGENLRLGIYVKLPETAEKITEPHGMFLGGAYVERWKFREPDALVGSVIQIDGLRHTLTDVLVRIERLDGTTQVARLIPESPSLTITASPSQWQVASTYFWIGVEHIVLGFDHLLFVLGLLLLADTQRAMFKTITAFTIAHSITLALSVFSVIRVPEAPLNCIIALSILFLGPEVVRKWRGQTSLTIRHSWLVAFAFGLLHGIGFASGLTLTGLPQRDIPSALFFFNVGVEAGQIAFVCLAVGVASSLRTLDLDRAWWVKRIPAYAVGALGAFWSIERLFVLFNLS